ncbi:glycerophosphodiester phosphodiesterase [Mucilaginibacter sp. Bleaf8]|uniref:glycerophosphodiester phosphodiesterase family protein n=1 Tax=Mucilaginibacter sp. Bleaf8 TaxID=2834430 RepID=UPI001BCC675A|nr:glycerophosphodiester phosphodiesterase family protein [Mucilaginibacter sp. Bleaf8]MBS7564941.1 glycerophosphodiester phosphodiesterase [Mucilaginibacter sp. Bleaf8]
MKYLFGLGLCLSVFKVSAQQKLDVQGHRGGRGLMPENSIPAMLHAVDLGVKTLELDCVISQDGKVVVSHDVYMSADFMRKPDGSEITKGEEKQLLLYKMPYDSIRQYDGGTKPHAQFPDQKKVKTYKPLLADLIDSVEHYIKAKHLKPVYYNLEIKSSPTGDNVAHPESESFVGSVMAVLNDKKVAKRVCIQSFDIRPLQILHKKYTKQTLSLLTFNQDSFEASIAKLGFEPQIISPYFSNVTPTLVKDAHDHHVKVLPWTVNDEPSMKKMAELQVDGIISDYPDRLIKLFGSYQK